MSEIIEKTISTLRKYKSVLLWILFSILIAIALQILTHIRMPTYNIMGIKETFLNPIQKGLTYAVVYPLIGIMKFFGVLATFQHTTFAGITGAYIDLSGFRMEVIYECTGIYAWIVYSATVLAYPTGNYIKNMWGFLIGIPAIYLINLIRFVILGLVGAYWPAGFDFIHAYLWQLIMIGFLILLFWCFIVWFAKDLPGKKKK
jgi:archaeosortase B (VPXXXP-CTERM-specific)